MAYIYGAPAWMWWAQNDSLSGTNANDVIYGYGGNDTIRAWNGQDYILGGDGNDTVYGGYGNDKIEGGRGADHIDGGLGWDVAEYRHAGGAVVVDLIAGGTGGDANGDRYVGIEEVYGSRYNDFLAGTNTGNRLNGQQGADKLYGRGGNDTLYGSSGNDYMRGDDDNDLLYGGSDHDTLLGGNGNDTLNGESGNDRFYGDWGADNINGGWGYDTLYYTGSSARVQVFLDGQGSYEGYAHGDRVTGIEEVWGSRYDDAIFGNTASNKLVGWMGNDHLIEYASHGGNDTLDGGYGNDYLAGGAGADVLNGGANIDTASYSDSNAAVSVWLDVWSTPGIDPRAFGGHAEGDKLIGIENLTGSRYDDKLVGDTGHNVLNGLGGKDTLDGGLGDDTLSGGADADTFYFSTGSALGVDSFGNDTVTDFEPGVDVLAIGDYIYALPGNGLRASQTDEGVLLSMDEGTILLAGIHVSEVGSDFFV